MKLISMVEFVLEQTSKYKNGGLDIEYIESTSKYANFLKRPLELGMFVPCDEDGNVLSKPSFTGDDYEVFVSNEGISFNAPIGTYQQAKELILFEACEDISRNPSLDDSGFQEVWFNNAIIYVSWNKSKTIEDMIDNNLTLTESAQKQIGL